MTDPVKSENKHAIVVVDADKNVTQANLAAAQLLGSPVAALLNRPLNLGCDIDHLLQHDEKKSELLIRTGTETQTLSASSLKVDWHDQPYYIISLWQQPLYEQSQEELEHMSYHDHLTSLPNRPHFERKMALAIKEASKSKQNMALLYLDIDNFKAVNDNLGHCVGDLLLKQISQALTACTRRSDTVARLGGDEFAIVLPNLRKPSYAATVARKVLNRLNRAPFHLENNDVHAKISIGIAVYPYAGKKTVDLVKNSDSAMYDAKKRGKNQFRFFTEEFNESPPPPAVDVEVS
jgi:diguanylate cyclase (GGDEF)-like protein